MKFTDCFLHTRERPDRIDIKLEWIEFVFNFAEKEEIQADGRVRKWARIDETQKYLRIVILEDLETIHNAFFDRSFKPN